MITSCTLADWLYPNRGIHSRPILGCIYPYCTPISQFHSSRPNTCWVVLVAKERNTLLGFQRADSEASVLNIQSNLDTVRAEQLLGVRTLNLLLEKQIRSVVTCTRGACMYRTNSENAVSVSPPSHQQPPRAFPRFSLFESTNPGSD